MKNFSSKQWLIRSKPKKLDLSGCTLVDMHFHSRYSKDGIRSLPRVLNRCKKLGVGIAITEHNTIDGSMAALRDKKVLVIPGVELTSKEGVHILAYAYSPGDLVELDKKCIKPFLQKNPFVLNIGTVDLLDRLHKLNCIVGAAHPYFSYVGIQTARLKEPYTRKLDFVEVLNRHSLKRWNNKAYAWAIEYKRGLTGGSDGRYVHDVGKALTGMVGTLNCKEFLEGILHRRSFVIGTESNWLDKAWTTLTKEARILTHTEGLRIAKGQVKLGYGYYTEKLKDWVNHRKKSLKAT